MTTRKFILWIILGCHAGYAFYPWKNIDNRIAGDIGLIFVVLWYRWAYDIELFGKEDGDNE